MDSICGSPLSNTGQTVVDVEDMVPLHPALLAAATALSKRLLLGRLFPLGAVEVDEVNVAIPGVIAVRFVIGPTAPAAVA
jgi:hypothetical protein